jgi:hypothetical protein
MPRRPDFDDRPVAFFTADWHLREDQPEAWTGADYWTEQEKAVDFCVDLAHKFRVPLVVAGDIFHHWRPSPRLLAWTLKKLAPPTDLFIAIPGQHDLPAHDLNEIHRSGAGVLSEVLNVNYIPARDDLFQLVPWGCDIPKSPEPHVIVICHTMTYKGKPPFPGAPPEGEADRFICKHKGWRLIVAGDNHQSFVVENPPHGTLLSPGSLMRMTAAQISHKPAVWLLTDADELYPFYIPQVDGAITRDHLDRVAEHDERMDAFVKRISDGMEVGLSFEDNLKRFIAANRLGKDVQREIWAAVKGE